MRQAGLFGLSEHLKRLSAHGDPLEELGRIIDFEAFRPTLVVALATQDNVADARMEYLIRDRLSWLWLLGFDLGAPTPDANTIRLFREKLTETGALDAVFADIDRQLKERGYLAMGGQIVDATLVAAPRQRNTAPEKDAIKAGLKADEIWPDEPARATQKDTDARWTLKFVKAKPLANGKPGIDIAIPSFGYKSSVSICRTFGFIRKCKVTDGARFDGPAKHGSNGKAGSAVSIAGSRAADRCPSGQPRPTPPNRRSAPTLRTSLPGRKTRWV